MDPSTFLESLQRGLAMVPPIAIALVLLAGPTVALIGYRLVGVARRTKVRPEDGVVPFWVCNECRSVNELRLSRCYRCGLDRDRSEDVEIVVDQPPIRTMPANVPAGSPFAAVAYRGQQGPGVPVMADRSTEAPPVAVGPGRGHDDAPTPGAVESADRAEVER